MAQPSRPDSLIGISYYVVTIADALETHERICGVADADPAVLMPEQLAGALRWWLI
jgi:hypothetical protein